jgi:signal transduction histidine kinase
MARDYASPTELKVTLDMAQGTWLVSIEDDGRGFESDNIFDVGADEGYNDARVEQLQMLKSRWNMIGGTVEVSSNEESGTRIRMAIPTGE